jgi:uncharacterized membrane protein YfcA
LTVELGALSTAALLPAVIGIIIGQRIRKKLPEWMFLRVFFISLLSLGAFIIVHELSGLS